MACDGPPRVRSGTTAGARRWPRARWTFLGVSRRRGRGRPAPRGFRGAVGAGGRGPHRASLNVPRPKPASPEAGLEARSEPKRNHYCPRALEPVGEVGCGTHLGGMRPVRERPYPSDASDEEWAFVAPYPGLLPEGAAQRRRAVADAAARSPALVDRPPAGREPGRGRRVRVHGPRSVRAPARFRQARGPAHRRRPRQPHAAAHARERRPSGAGRRRAAEGLEAPLGRRHAGPPLGGARHVCGRAGQGPGRAAGRRGPPRRRRERRDRGGPPSGPRSGTGGRPGLRRRGAGQGCRHARHPAGGG